MSYRNQRRDSNRNNSGGSYGGGSGNYGGSRRQSYTGTGNSQVNPWQGGIVPGNQVSGLGLLPTPAQTNLLSQMSIPEAQLAVATNLLNKILSPPMQSSGGVPSLLSLPNPLGNRGMSSYNDYRSRSSFADRRRDRPQDRRIQPYNKSGSNRRGDEKSRLGKSRSSDKSSKAKDGENGDDSVEDDESKRDEDKKDGENGDDDNKALGEKYVGIPNALLTCHVCHKNMWDATSFANHMAGKRHQLMMEQLDETYKIKVELLRHEQRAAESQRELEIERLQRQGKKVFNNKREYCTMCDLHFHGNLISHRKKERHQKLKAFLHPKCHLCRKEFPNRLEWDDHKLSAPHLVKVVEYRRTVKPGLKDEDMEGNDIESLDGNDETFVDLDDDFDMSEIPSTVEEYDAEAPVGTNYVVEVSGHLCKICNKFINSPEEAEVHTKTLTHYKNFAGVVKMKVKAEKDKEAAEKAAEAKARREEREKKKDDDKDDDEGNWKRHAKDEETEEDSKKDEEKMEDSNENSDFVKENSEEMEVDGGSGQLKQEEAALDQDGKEEEVGEDECDTPAKGVRGRGGRGGTRNKARRGK